MYLYKLGKRRIKLNEKFSINEKILFNPNIFCASLRYCRDHPPVLVKLGPRNKIVPMLS